MAVCNIQTLLTASNCFGTLLAGQREQIELQLLCDIRAALTASDLTSYFSAALEASHVVKASAGELAFLSMFNDNAATRWLQVFNSTTVPADTTVPDLVTEVTAGATIQMPLTGRVPFATGISICISTTAATKTVGGADALFAVTYA